MSMLISFAGVAFTPNANDLLLDSGYLSQRRKAGYTSAVIQSAQRRRSSVRLHLYFAVKGQDE